VEDPAGPVELSVPGGREVRRVATGQAVLMMTASRDLRRMVSVGSHTLVHDLTAGTSVRLAGADSPPPQIVLSANGERAAIGTDRIDGDKHDYLARVFDARTGSLVAEFLLERPAVALAFSGDGRFLVTA